MIENPHLRAIFLMLRQDLKDSDIPHRTTLWTQITEIWKEQLELLESEMEVSPSFFLIATLIIRFLRTHLAKSHLRWIYGLTLIYHHSWL